MTASGQRQRAAGAGESPLVTSCGRRILVKELRLPTPGRPIGRVTLDVGPDQGDEHGVWASLTPAEARELARRLLVHAAGVEPAGPPDQKAPRAHGLSLDASPGTAWTVTRSRSV
ncbi:hypothetical protein [Streptomyces triticiradicis]|uniref:hypothetical protein n=1 Tax=Streptomyces triticiradicis TaxID=2651189 RepID=UPI001CED84AE|nr:hypothetical protein [Streptomyces triticiradicis]